MPQPGKVDLAGETPSWSWLRSGNCVRGARPEGAVHDVGHIVQEGLTSGVGVTRVAFFQERQHVMRAKVTLPRVSILSPRWRNTKARRRDEPAWPSCFSSVMDAAGGG